ncbi:MAG TPA: hypothetical protein DCG12_19455 [Planctomycetaceae bacterium]|nr:hypothetical protein [Planctomycetaceae bacterium]
MSIGIEAAAFVRLPLDDGSGPGNRNHGKRRFRERLGYNSGWWVEAEKLPANTEKAVSEAMERLTEFRRLALSSDHDDRRAVVASVVSQISIEFKQTKKGSRTFSDVSGCLLTYQNECSGKSRDDRI